MNTRGRVIGIGIVVFMTAFILLLFVAYGIDNPASRNDAAAPTAVSDGQGVSSCERLNAATEDIGIYRCAVIVPAHLNNYYTCFVSPVGGIDCR